MNTQPAAATLAAAGVVSGTLGLVTPGDEGRAKAAPAKTFTAQAPLALRASGAASATVIHTLPVGSIVYPTGKKSGLF